MQTAETDLSRRSILRSLPAVALVPPAMMLPALPAVRDPFDDLTRRWTDLVRDADDPSRGDSAADDAESERLYHAIAGVEDLVQGVRGASLVGIILKLRIVARHMNNELACCENYDGVRTNDLEPNEIEIAGVIDDAEQLAGVVA